MHERNRGAWAHKGVACFTGAERSMASRSAHVGLHENKEKQACGRWAAALVGLARREKLVGPGLLVRPNLYGPKAGPLSGLQIHKRNRPWA